MPVPQGCGFQRLTTSGVVSDSGKSIMVCGTDVESGASAAVPWLTNGAALSAGGATGSFPLGPNTVSQGNIQAFNFPIVFSNGCFVSFDANTTAVTVYYILNSVSATS